MKSAMRVLLDTSVLVASMLESHTKHLQAFKWLSKCKEGAYTGIISLHSLAELYAVFTSLPIHPKIAPAIAWQMIHENLLSSMEIISLSKTDYINILRSLTVSQITGGAVYDALICHCAVKGDAERIVTLNVKDFNRICPSLAHIIIEP